MVMNDVQRCGRGRGRVAALLPGAPVEVEKQDLERGTYQHPELYGQPPEMGMNYDAERTLHDRPDAERPASRSLPDATPR